ncbi:MAG: hypothetical protein MUE42_04135 [Opitutaceae bacterium]|nr:hypothetical protein [Opitutaceae bacterium]
MPEAAQRDAIALKIQIDSAATPTANLMPALAVLSRFCQGAPVPPPFVQLTRAQLKELIGTLAGQPVFFSLTEPGKNLLWLGPRLRGVSEHLAGPVSAAVPANPVPVAAGPRSLSVRTPRIVPREEPVTPLTVDGSEHYLAVTLPSRDHPAYASARELLASHGFALDPSTKKWWLRDRHKVLNFLASQGEVLRTRYHAEFTPNFEKQTATLAEATVETKVADAGGGEFAVTIGLAAGKAGEDDLRAALAAGRRFVEDGGKVYLLPPEQLDKLAARAAG